MGTIKTDIDIFLEISSHLTGFSKIELQGTGMQDIYYKKIIEAVEAGIVSSFFAKSKEILALHETPKSLKDKSCTDLMPNDKYNRLAKTIIIMWYTGEWEKLSDGSWVGQVISVESYKQGLIWGVAETHPPGAKQPGFASWSTPPIQVRKKASDQEVPKASSPVNETDLIQIDK